MTPSQINAAMPLGQSMAAAEIKRAIEPLVGYPVHVNEVVKAMKVYAAYIDGGERRNTWREWTRVADIPEPQPTGPDYPCEVRFEQREVGLSTKSAGSRIVRVTLPREPWVNA